MKLDDIEIGKDYADSSSKRYPSRVRVVDIGKVEESTGWKGRTKLSKRRKVTVQLLKPDGTPFDREPSVYSAQQIKCLWEDHLKEKERRDADEKEIKALREAKKQKALEQQATILEILSALDDFDTRENHEGIKTLAFNVHGINMSVSSYGTGKIEMTYDRFLELAGELLMLQPD